MTLLWYLDLHVIVKKGYLAFQLSYWYAIDFFCILEWGSTVGLMPKSRNGVGVLHTAHV